MNLLAMMGRGVGWLRIGLLVVIFVLVSCYFLCGIHFYSMHKYLDNAHYIRKLLWPCVALCLVLMMFRVNRATVYRQGKLLAPLVVAAIVGLAANRDVAFFQHVKILFYLGAAECCIATFFTLRKRHVFGINALNSIVLAVHTFYQLHVGIVTLPGSQINVNIYAGMAILLGTVEICSLIYRDIPRIERISHVIIGLVLYGLALETGARTALVTEFVMGIILAFYIGRQYNIRLFGIGAAIIVIFLVLSCFAMSDAYLMSKLMVIDDQVRGFCDLKQGEAASTSVGLRLAMWKVAMSQVVPNYPIVGIGDMRHFKLEHFIDASIIDPNFEVWHFHNELINTIAKGGVVRLVASLMTLYFMICQAKGRPELICMLLAAGLWGSTEVFVEHSRLLTVFFSIWVLFDMVNYSDNDKKLNNRTEKALCVAS